MKFSLRSIYNNIISGSYNFFAKIFIQLIFPPLMLLFWGKTQFEIWLYIFAIPGTLFLFNFSTSAPARNEMSILYHNKKFNQLSKIYHNSNLISFFFILFACVIFFLFILTKLDEIFFQQNLGTILIIFFSSIIKISTSIYYSSLTFKGSLKTFNIVDALIDIVAFSIIPFLGIYFSQLFYASLFLFILNIIHILILYELNKSFHKNFISLRKIIEIKNIKLNTIKSLFIKSIGFNLDSINNLLKNQVLIFILGLIGNLSIVGLISTSKTLFYYFPLRISSIISDAFFIEYTKLSIKDKSFKKIFSYKLIFIILFIFIIILFSNLLGIYFYNFWINNSYELSTKLLNYILIDFIFFILGTYFILPLKSHNKINFISFVEFIINLLTILYIYLNIHLTIIDIYEIIILSSGIIFISKVFYFFNICKFKKK